MINDFDLTNACVNSCEKFEMSFTLTAFSTVVSASNVVIETATMLSIFIFGIHIGKNRAHRNLRDRITETVAPREFDKNEY